MSFKPLRLGLNVDHVATVRNARGGRRPDPVRAALLACEAGADGITAHLREDRRHIHDDDIIRLRELLPKPLNLEMAATPEMLAIALRTKPHAACLVPEKREEQTTEGGLEVAGRLDELAPIVSRLTAEGIRVSLFIEPSRAAVEAAHQLRAPVIEFHTGTWCHAVEAGETDRASAEFERLRNAAALADDLGLECHAGPGLDYETAERIAALPQIVELNIGHFIVGEAMMIGLPAALIAMREAMNSGRENASEAP